MNQNAKIRVIHNIESPKIDIIIDKKTVLSNVIYKKMTNYMYVSPGKHTVAIKNDGDII
jgi:hypothetical protein